MFPSLDLEQMTQELNENELNENIDTLGDVILMDFDDNGNATVIIEDGKVKLAKTIEDKIKAYTQVLLRTEFNKYKVYKDEDFGMNYFKFIGTTQLIQLVNVELKREITEKLTKLNVIDSISDFNSTLIGKKLKINFTIKLSNNNSVNISEVI